MGRVLRPFVRRLHYRSDSILTKQYLFACQATLDWLGSPSHAARSTAPKGIKDLFYETRVLSGREFTVTRFAKEVLGGAVDPVMLGYIEKGKRFPNEALVRRLAAVRDEPVAPLLAVLYRDRMLYAFGRELRRALHDPAAVEGIADADLAVQVSRAIAALPDDGSWVTVGEVARADRRRGARQVEARATSSQVTTLLKRARPRRASEGQSAPEVAPLRRHDARGAARAGNGVRGDLHQGDCSTRSVCRSVPLRRTSAITICTSSASDFPSFTNGSRRRRARWRKSSPPTPVPVRSS